MPPAKPYHFHPEAWQEFESADNWYHLRSADTGVRFVAAIYDALENIARWPQTWSAYHQGTRRFVLQEFPYAVIYRDKESAVQILAIAHCHRRPRYWKKRL